MAGQTATMEGQSHRRTRRKAVQACYASAGKDRVRLREPVYEGSLLITRRQYRSNTRGAPWPLILQSGL